MIGILFVLTLLILGLPVIYFLKVNNNCLVTIPLSFGVGSFMVTIQLFIYFFILRLSYSDVLPYIYLAEVIVFLIISLKILKETKLKISLATINLALGRIKTKEIIIIFLILLQVLFVSINAWSKPTLTYDSVSMWTYKAKILYHEGSISYNINEENYLGGGSHINYPWHIPLLQYWLFVLLGEVNDLQSNIVFVLYFLSLLMIVFWSIKDRIGNFAGLVFVFFLSSMPLINYHAFNAYADLPLSFYLFVTSLFLFKWFEKREVRYIIISALFMGAAMYVKIETIIFFIASIFVALISQIQLKEKRYKQIFTYLYTYTVLISFWIYYLIANRIGISNVIPGVSSHIDVFPSIFRAFFISGNWNIWWFIVVFMLVIAFREIIKNKALFLGWLWLLISYLGLIILYVFTNEYQFVINNTATARNLILLVPVSIFLTAVTYGNYLKNQEMRE